MNARTLRIVLAAIFLCCGMSGPLGAQELSYWTLDNPNRDGPEVSVRIISTDTPNKYQVVADSIRIVENPNADPSNIDLRLIWLDGAGNEQVQPMKAGYSIVIETSKARVASRNGGHLQVSGQLRLLKPKASPN